MITQDTIKSILRYDKETGIFTRISSGENTGYTVVSPDGNEYTCISIKGKHYRAHRLAVLYVTGSWPKASVSHKDRDRKNNSWENIWQATQAEIMKCASLPARSSTGTLGVYKSGKKWKARIGVDRRCINLGTFDNENLAKDARKAAEHKYGFRA